MKRFLPLVPVESHGMAELSAAAQDYGRGSTTGENLQTYIDHQTTRCFAWQYPNGRGSIPGT